MAHGYENPGEGQQGLNGALWEGRSFMHSIKFGRARVFREVFVVNTDRREQTCNG